MYKKYLALNNPQSLLCHKNKPNHTNLFILLSFGLVVRVLATGSGDLGSISGRVISKTQKMVLNTQQYKVRIKGKVEQSRERSRTLPYTLV